MFRKSIILSSLCCIGSASPLAAVDANHNSISDVWENLYSAAMANLDGDTDGDGQSNRAEGMAWTNPGNPASFFSITNYAHHATGDQFTVPGEPWMRDLVRYSADLVEWPRFGQTGIGTGTPTNASLPPGGAKRFHRAARHDSLNSDTDSLTNKEEKIIGTNPLLWDTDGDKVPDDVEFLIGTNPLTSTNTDGDAFPDDWEQWCIRFNPSDSVTSLADVNSSSDFDGDGVSDLTEFTLGTNPVRKLKNVILFLSEDQSIDLSCMGTVGIATPSIDTLASNGMLFERAFAMSPVCSTSKMCMFTSTFCQQNSTWRNVENYGTAFPLPSTDPSLLNLGGINEDLPTLIEILRDRGFYTATSHKSHVQPVRKWPYSKGYGQPTTAAVATSYINDLVTQAGNRPFYMTFGVGAPHLPFRGIAQNQGLWSATGGLTGDGRVTNVNANALVVPNCYPDVPGVRQDIADYYGAIQCVDTVFGAVMAALQANGVLNDTLVIYTSDHGIGLHRAKQSIYAMGTQIPFIVAGAGITANIKTKTPVSHADILPTLLDYLGIEKLPNLAGASLMPVLSSATTEVPGRNTVLTTAQDFSDGRAVCDGRYYYINNVRKIAGGSLANPSAGLNTDEYQGGSPWYNRTYDATVAATGSVGRQLLSDLLTGSVPDEELYDLDADRWCVVNLAQNPSLTTVKAQLKAELNAWRVRTEDYNTSHTEVTRRTLRYEDPTGGPAVTGPPIVDDFNSKSGNLTADPAWTTLISGTTADFILSANMVDAPGGPITLAQWDAAILPAGGTFSVAVKTGFDGNGVAGGIAFGITPNSGGGQDFWQFMLADGRSATGGVDKDIRLFRVVASAQVNPPLLSENSLTNYSTNGSLFTLEVSGQQGSAIVSLRVLDPTGAVYFSNPAFNLGSPVPTGSTFGLSTWSSGSSIFDDFAIALSNPPRSVLVDFDSGTGNLSNLADWTLAIAGNSGADFVFEANPFPAGTGKVIDAPPGGQPPVAVYEALALASGETFSATLDTGFVGAGVYGGLVFGFESGTDFLSFELADGLTAASLNRLFRIRRHAGGTFTDLLFPAAGTLPIIERNKSYRLSLGGKVGNSEITYSITSLETSSILTSGTFNLPSVILAGSKFGLTASSSSSSKYDHLTISTTP